SFGLAIADSSNNNTIGGIVPGSRNVISGNGWGVSIASGSAPPTGNVVQGNYIGISADGSTPLSNRVEGVRLTGAVNTIIGGTVPEAANVIAFNGTAPQPGIGTGIEVLSGTGNSIRGNSIFSNGALGIDLANDGVTANDNGDADTGPNNRQNFPVISSVVTGGGQTTIA